MSRKTGGSLKQIPTNSSVPTRTTSFSKGDNPNEDAAEDQLDSDTPKNLPAQAIEALSEEDKRKFWMIAAKSAANFVTDLSLREDIPDVEEIKHAIAPLDPKKWGMRKSTMKKADLGLTHEGAEIRYDDENEDDDDLSTFFEYDERERIPRSSEPKAQDKKNKIDDSSNRSSAAMNEHRASRLSESRSAHLEGSSHTLRASITSADAQEPRRSDKDEPRQSGQAEGEDASEDWGFYDESELDESVTKMNITFYKPADVNINTKDALLELESLLEDLKLEGRITERYKNRMVNKYTLLLQALIASQEKEIEIIGGLETKEKILKVLTSFLRAEDADEKLEETDSVLEGDEEEGGSLENFGDKLNKPEDGNEKEGEEDGSKQSHGLSIEEMTAETIRETLLQQKSRLDVLDAVKRIRMIQLKQLEFEKTLLTLHYSRMMKPSELQKQTRDCRRAVNELQLDMGSLQLEVDRIQGEIKNLDKVVHDEEKLVDKLELEALTKQNEVQTLANKPIAIAKEAEREALKLEQLIYHHNQVRAEYLDTMKTLRLYKEDKDRLTKELNALMKEETRLNSVRKEAMVETENLLLEMESLLEKEQALLETHSALNEDIAQASRTKKRLQEEQHKITLEANKAVRDSQKIDKFIRLASESFINTKLAYEKMRLALDTASPKDDLSNWEKLIKMLTKEITNLKADLTRKLDDASSKAGIVERLQVQINDLYNKQLSAGKQLQEMIRDEVKKRREREEKSEQCIKLESQLYKLTQEKKIHEIMLDDCVRSQKDLNRKLEQYRRKYNQIRLERAAMMSEVVGNRQKLVEAYERLKVCDGEINFINSRLKEAGKEIKIIHFKNLNARLICDSVQNEWMKKRKRFFKQIEEKTEAMISLKTLRQELKKLGIATNKQRSDRSKIIQSIEHISVRSNKATKEICIFMEYIKGYDRILMRGRTNLKTRELELSKLSASHKEITKRALIHKLKAPDEEAIFRNVDRLRAQVFEVVELRMSLEKKMNDDDSMERVRLLNFAWIEERENVPKLEKKLDQVEETIALREAQGLEKSLVHRMISKVCDDSFKAIRYLKDKYGEDVKAIATMRKRLNDLNRKIEGLTSEVASAIAVSDSAEKELGKIKKIFRTAVKNFAEGNPPTQEFENEWNHSEWREEMLARSYKKTGRFHRKVKPETPHQVQVKRFKPRPRALEEDNILGFSFSVINDITTSR